MGRVVVQAADTVDGRITRVRVRMAGLPPRVLDREAVVAWMRDGHSFLPELGSAIGRALQLVEVGDELFVRDDHDQVAADALPAGLPAVG
jgi:hypothetical protein